MSEIRAEPHEETSVIGWIANDLLEEDFTYASNTSTTMNAATPRGDTSPRPTWTHKVCAFFTSQQGCARRSCPFVHDSTVASSMILKPCPNTGCGNLCIGQQCQACHLLMKNKPAHRSSSELKQPRTQARDHFAPYPHPRPTKLCPETDCENPTHGGRCRECRLRQSVRASRPPGVVS